MIALRENDYYIKHCPKEESQLENKPWLSNRYEKSNLQVLI